ncbi:MAG: hypothetical protein HC831_29880 [Chloroflexia bacterium]|nr:hypothetical protein [Chloroflexia bacterium]
MVLDNINDSIKLIGAYSTPATVETLFYECSCQTNDYEGNVISTFTEYTDVQGGCGAIYSGSLTTGCSDTNADPIVSYIPIEPQVEVDSDGVVVAESARGFPGAQTAIMDGSNHQQMRNDDNTKKRLTELYNGLYGPYFITRPR